MDLDTRRYATFADLRVYCERVASAVGLASIEIFGYDDPRTREYAVELGLALQLTNILRDVGADAARGPPLPPARGPRPSRRRRGGAPRRGARRLRAPRPAGLDALLSFEAERARVALRRARPRCCRSATAARCSPPRSWAPSTATLLEEWARRGHPVGGERVSLGKPRKLWTALRTIPRVYWSV